MTNQSYKTKSIKKNYVFNLIYQIFLIIVPVFVTPYVSRVLGVEGTGRYSYTYSIVTYFTLFAALGFNNYAQRLVASHQGDSKQQSIDFWSIFYARLIPVSGTIAIYIILAFLGVYGNKYSTLMWIQSINLVAVAVDIVFLFQGNEEFGKIVFRNVIIKCLSIAAIFIFVKTKKDLMAYTFIQSVSIFMSNISLWFYLPKYLVKVKGERLNPLRHLGPTLVLFLPTIATSVYTSLDKIMIGLITGSDAENGNYEYAEKIVKISMTVITSLGTVMIPRNSKNFAQGNIDAVKRNIYQSCKFVMLLGIPLTLGMIAVADNMIPWYLGSGYDKAAMLMKLLAPIVIIIGFSNVFGLQFLIPCHMDKRFTVAIISGAVSNFSLNLFCIRQWGAYGAAIATVVAEMVVTTVMVVFIREYVRISQIFQSSWKYAIAGLVMYIVLYVAFDGYSASIIHTATMAVTGAGVYFAMLFLLHEDFIGMGMDMLKRGIRKIK